MLRVREVAELLRVSTATVYALLKRGELEPVWIGASIRVSAEAVEALVARGGAGGRQSWGARKKAR
jgi:excisionase family DNA binding protein